MPAALPRTRSSLAVSRRALLGAASALALAATLPARAQQNNTPVYMPDGAEFKRSDVVDLARALAKRPYAPPASPLPDWLTGLNLEQYNSIRNRPERAVWLDQPRGFVLEPLHRGFIYQAPVQLFAIEGGRVRKIVYSPQRYDLGRLNPPQNVNDIGFSGFRISKSGGGQPARDIALFQGATFLRAAARGQAQGAVARALSLKTADPRGEEFPFFRAFWVEQPQRDDTIIVHALLDSESVSGAFSYTIRAGEVTQIDTEAAIFPRVALDNFGIAGLQATYLYSVADKRGADDFRAGVHEVGGLQMHSGAGEWIYRPVVNPRQLQISAFMDENPRGFGFVLRDRDFSLFQDHDARFEIRPSLWIEPIGDWGPGAVQLIEIPSDNEIHDNIIAQWRPKEPLAAGSEHFLAYRQHWAWSPPERVPLATASGYRVGRGSAARRRRFVVDFMGEKLAGLKPDEISAAFWCSNNGMSNLRLIHGVGGKATRVAFELDTGSESLIELRLVLKSGDAPVSETWLYRWTP